MTSEELFQNAWSSLESFAKEAIDKGLVSEEELVDAMLAEVDPDIDSGKYLALSAESQAVLTKMAPDTNPNTLEVMRKLLKNTRMAALTLKGVEPAVYKDEPLIP